jgi:hypothetical protein
MIDLCICRDKGISAAANENIPAMAVRFSTIHRRDFSPSVASMPF